MSNQSPPPHAFIAPGSKREVTILLHCERRGGTPPAWGPKASMILGSVALACGAICGAGIQGTAGADCGGLGGLVGSFGGLC
jgi:hypothetical protein